MQNFEKFITFCICNPVSKIGSIINVGVRKIEPTKKYKKVEHKFEKSVKMELTKNQNGGQNYALHLFYRKTNRIARHNNK